MTLLTNVLHALVTELFFDCDLFYLNLNFDAVDFELIGERE